VTVAARTRGRSRPDPRGVALGEEALLVRPEGADVVLLDEFGPLELAGDLWRPFADALAAGPGTPVLTVREELIGPVRDPYARRSPRVVRRVVEQ